MNGLHHTSCAVDSVLHRSPYSQVVGSLEAIVPAGNREKTNQHIMAVNYYRTSSKKTCTVVRVGARDSLLDISHSITIRISGIGSSTCVGCHSEVRIPPILS